jgi:hypothetical protein
MRSKTRIAVATLAVVLLTGGSVAAAEASNSASPSPKSPAACVGTAPSDVGKGKQPVVKPGTPDPQISAALARILGVSQARATAVLERLDAISQASGHGVEVTDPGFRSLAASLGLTPSQLSQDLVRMKQALRAAMPAPSGSASAKG